MLSTRFKGKISVIAGYEHYLGKVRIRVFVPNCKLEFGCHLRDATAPYLAGKSVSVDVNNTRSKS